MTKIEEFKPGTVDHETVFPALEASHFAASVMLQMLIELRGPGPWIQEMHENMRNSVDRQPPAKGWTTGKAQWRAAQHDALDAIFAHQHIVGSVRPKH